MVCVSVCWVVCSWLVASRLVILFHAPRGNIHRDANLEGAHQLQSSLLAGRWGASMHCSRFLSAYSAHPSAPLPLLHGCLSMCCPAACSLLCLEANRPVRHWPLIPTI